MKEPIDLEFAVYKADPEMIKMLLTLNDQVYKKETGKILLWLTSLKITKASWWEIFLSSWMIVCWLRSRT